MWWDKFLPNLLNPPILPEPRSAPRNWRVGKSALNFAIFYSYCSVGDSCGQKQKSSPLPPDVGLIFWFVVLYSIRLLSLSHIYNQTCNCYKYHCTKPYAMDNNLQAFNNYFTLLHQHLSFPSSAQHLLQSELFLPVVSVDIKHHSPLT